MNSKVLDFLMRFIYLMLGLRAVKNWKKQYITVGAFCILYLLEYYLFSQHSSQVYLLGCFYGILVIWLSCKVLKAKTIALVAKICLLHSIYEIVNMLAIGSVVILKWLSKAEVNMYLTTYCFLIKNILMCLIVEKFDKVSDELEKSYRNRYLSYLIFVVVIGMKLPFMFTSDNDMKSFKILLVCIIIFTTIFFIITKIDKHFAALERAKIEEENRRLAAQLHKSKEILPAMVSVLAEVTEKTGREMDEPDAKELLQEVRDLYGQQLVEDRREELFLKNFCSSGLKLLDQQLLGYLQEAADKNINMDIYIPAPIASVIKRENIDQLDMQRAVGDMVRNAFRAIERKKAGGGTILLIIGCRDVNILEIVVWDNGEEFPLEVLSSFGRRGVSTGGTGNGLADLMKFVREAGASIKIEELDWETSSFTKGISVIFDHRHSYTLESPRKGRLGTDFWNG